jgi:chaperonin cofactor prefoldin
MINKIEEKKEELSKKLENLVKEYQDAQEKLAQIQTKIIAHKGALETIEELIEQQGD